MWAASGLDGDGGQAMWALFRCRLGGRRFLLPLHPVDAAEEGALAASARADDGGYISGRNIKGNVLDRLIGAIKN